MLSDDYFNADGPFYAWIDYDASSHALAIRISLTDTRPTDATLSTTIDFADYAGSEYYVGFTSATGGSRQNHIISQWLFSNTYVSGGLDPEEEYSMDSTPPTAPKITASGGSAKLSDSTDADSDLAGYEYKVDGGSWSSGDSVDLGALSAGPHTILGRALDKVGNISKTTTYTYNLVTVSYNNNGGTGSATGGSYNEGTAVTLSDGKGITKENYTLSGWNTQADGKGTHYNLGASITAPGSNLTLYAEWKAEDAPTTKNHNVTIYVDGRSTLTASASGGTWTYDNSHLKLTDNGDGTASITGLKKGTTAVTYTADNLIETFTVTIKTSSLPSTGQDFTWVWVLGTVALVTLGLAGLLMRRYKTRV
jgi:uncharacterized repeat protein (TIGR02543 family)